MRSASATATAIIEPPGPPKAGFAVAQAAYESGVSIGLHAWSITSITSINPRAADSVKNILQYRHINGGIVQTRTTEVGVRGGTPAPGRLWGMQGGDVTAGGGCGAHCAVRQGSSGSADSATGKFWGSREQPGAGRRLGGGVEWACRRAESANTASIAL